MKKIISILSICMILMGAFGFLLNMFISLGFVNVNMELPLEEIQGVVEKNNKIYVGQGKYSRVQVYDLNGNYIKYIATNTNGKDFDFRIDDYDIVFTQTAYFRNVITSHLDEHSIVFTIEGKYPYEIVCYTHNTRQITIKQRYFKSLVFAYTAQALFTIIGLILFYIANLFKF
ncbi:MAG: hypothetical protein ACOVSR_10910 [Bacteroidia bacterium]